MIMKRLIALEAALRRNEKSRKHVALDDLLQYKKMNAETDLFVGPAATKRLRYIFNAQKHQSQLRAICSCNEDTFSVHMQMYPSCFHSKSYILHFIDSYLLAFVSLFRFLLWSPVT